MLPISSRIKAIAAAAGAAAALAGLSSLTSADLSVFGDWQTAGTLGVAALIGFMKTDNALANWLRRYGKPEAAALIAPSK